MVVQQNVPHSEKLLCSTKQPWVAQEPLITLCTTSFFCLPHLFFTSTSLDVRRGIFVLPSIPTTQNITFLLYGEVSKKEDLLKPQISLANKSHGHNAGWRSCPSPRPGVLLSPSRKKGTPQTGSRGLFDVQSSDSSVSLCPLLLTHWCLTHWCICEPKNRFQFVQIGF